MKKIVKKKYLKIYLNIYNKKIVHKIIKQKKI